jgi:hypothetical protein
VKAPRVKKKEPVGSRTHKQQADSKRAASLPAAPRAGPSSPDTRLLIGGLALVVLVLGDTMFLALSTRFLRVR